MKILIGILIWVGFVRSTHAQSVANARNALSAEVKLPGHRHSINYERLIARGFSLRAGVYLFELPSSLVVAQYGLGASNTQLELGLGANFLEPSERLMVNGLSTIGVRSVWRGTLIRAGTTIEFRKSEVGATFHTAIGLVF